MSHPSEELLLAFADGELEGDRRREVEVHVKVCGLCRHALRDLEQAMSGMKVELALLDAAEPAEWGTHALPRATRPGRSGSLGSRASALSANRRVHGSPRAGVATGRSMRWATVLVLLIGGGAAAMVAPRWQRNQAPVPASAFAATRAAAAPRTPVVPVAEIAQSSAAVSILPVGGEATVALTSVAGTADARVFVEVSDRSDVQVTVSTATSEHATPRFTSAEGRLAVQLTGRGAEVHVALPATLRRARITHDGATVISVSGGAVVPAIARTSGVLLEATERGASTESQ
jgi:hypothetical protein